MKVLKTVEYAFPSLSALVLTTTDISTTPNTQLANAFTVTIPETDGLVFKSVFVETRARDCTNVNAKLATVRSQAQLGAATTLEQSLTPAFVYTGGEHFTTCFQFDVTSHFVANWTGSSMAFNYWLAVSTPTGGSWGNFVTKLIVTYEYEDTTNSTRIKTVRIPLHETVNGPLTNSLAEFGTNAIPQLSTLLPENSVSILNLWFDIRAIDHSSSTTGFSLEMQVDSDTVVNSATLGQQKTTSTAFTYFLNYNSLDPATTHTLKLRSNNLTSRFCAISVILYITYTYNHSATTRILNSVMLPLDLEANSNATALGPARSKVNFLIAEPGTLTLHQSALVLATTDAGGTGFLVSPNVRAGPQASDKAYLFTQAGVATGEKQWLYRVDAGGSLGTGFRSSLARGFNTLDFRYYRTPASTLHYQASFLCGYLLLNYSSDVPTGGDGRANHTVWQLTHAVSDYGSYQVAGVDPQAVIPTFTPIFPTANTYINGWMFQIIMDFTQSSPSNVLVEIEPVGTESGRTRQTIGRFFGGGMDLPSDVLFQFPYPVRRFPQDVSSPWKADSQRPLTLNVITASTAYFGVFQMAACVTMHHITYPVSGTVHGYEGDGSGITISLHRADTGDQIASTVTTAGGQFSIPYYIDLYELFTMARQSPTRKARSDNKVPG